MPAVGIVKTEAVRYRSMVVAFETTGYEEAGFE